MTEIGWVASQMLRGFIPGDTFDFGLGTHKTCAPERVRDRQYDTAFVCKWLVLVAVKEYSLRTLICVMDWIKPPRSHPESRFGGEGSAGRRTQYQALMKLIYPVQPSMPLLRLRSLVVGSSE